MAAVSQIVTDIDYGRRGKQQGYLRVPYSHNQAGWASLQIPITVRGYLNLASMSARIWM